MTHNFAEPERLVNGALWYAQAGWKILPCHGLSVGGKCTCLGLHSDPKDVGKHPAISEWQHKASSDPTTVSSWWHENPDYNVGVMARDSGFFVIDIDPRSGGFASFDKFEAAVSGALPPTVEAYTGTYMERGKSIRGRHMLYACSPNEVLVGNLKAHNMPGIDIKHNGYILTAPSRHFSGVEYQWVEGKAPWETEIAQAPEELLQFLRRKGSYKSPGVGGWGGMGSMSLGGEKVDIDKMLEEGIDEGSRAVDVYKLACALANKYGTSPMDRLTIETMMMRFNHEKIRPPMEMDGPGGLLSHVRRAIDYVAANPKDALLWNGVGDKDQALAWAASQHQPRAVAPAQSTESGSFSGYASGIAPNTSDPDDADDLPTPRTYNGGAAAVETTSTDNVPSVGGPDLPKDPDSVIEGGGGTPGRRSLTDVGNGRRLVDNYGHMLRYTPALGWFYWNDHYWAPDVESLGVKELSKYVSGTIAREAYLYDDDGRSKVLKWAQDSKSNGKLNALMDNAQSDPRIYAQLESWDRDPELLGVLNGVINLRTGELHKGDPELFLTKRAPVAYTPGLRNARWEAFLDHATGGDVELQEWIQKVAGYTLTGLRTHDIMILVYGPPGSGKTTFVEALVKALGTSQYAMSLDSSILSGGDNMSNNTDMYHWAEMRGRRMIWVEELPENERLKENTVKKLTGSSEIPARSPGEKPFTFQSQGKLWITTNHRPVITDDAMWRRIRPVPWSHTPTTPDPGLRDFLSDPEGGLPAILAWAVEGAIKVLNSKESDPIGWCAAVREAADIYRKNEDRIGMFLEEETEEQEGALLSIKSLYSVYQGWSSERGERAMSQIAFHRKLQDRGEKIEGQGGRAVLEGRGTRPRLPVGGLAELSQPGNWNGLIHAASF